MKEHENTELWADGEGERFLKDVTTQQIINWVGNRMPVVLDDNKVVWVYRTLPGHDREGDQCFMGCLDDPIRTNKREIEMRLFKVSRIRSIQV